MADECGAGVAVAVALCCCARLAPPHRQLEMACLNMETGLPEPYPHGWWAVVIDVSSQHLNSSVAHMAGLPCKTVLVPRCRRSAGMQSQLCNSSLCCSAAPLFVCVCACLLQAMQLTDEQKAALKICWEKVHMMGGLCCTLSLMPCSTPQLWRVPLVRTWIA